MNVEQGRPQRIRRALRHLVAEHGFHGASMQAVAKQAGVASGTAYVHYASKDELVMAAYYETKNELLYASAVGVEAGLSADQVFQMLWRNMYRHLVDAPERARFLLQVEVSPYRTGQGIVDGPPTPPVFDFIMDRCVDLPPLVLFDLAVGPALRLVASGIQLPDEDLNRLADACWRAIADPTKVRS